jgi:ATP-dependent Clp protease adaptor protein ClpS
MTTSTVTLTMEEILNSLPPKHKVIFHNDDVTSVDYVISVLSAIFNFTYEEGEELAYEIDREGYGVAGVYDEKIAQLKCEQVKEMNKQYGKNLKVTHEPE